MEGFNMQDVVEVDGQPTPCRESRPILTARGQRYRLRSVQREKQSNKDLENQRLGLLDDFSLKSNPILHSYKHESVDVEMSGSQLPGGASNHNLPARPPPRPHSFISPLPASSPNVPPTTSSPSTRRLQRKIRRDEVRRIQAADPEDAKAQISNFATLNIGKRKQNKRKKGTPDKLPVPNAKRSRTMAQGNDRRTRKSKNLSCRWTGGPAMTRIRTPAFWENFLVSVSSLPIIGAHAEHLSLFNKEIALRQRAEVSCEPPMQLQQLLQKRSGKYCEAKDLEAMAAMAAAWNFEYGNEDRTREGWMRWMVFAVRGLGFVDWHVNMLIKGIRASYAETLGGTAMQIRKPMKARDDRKIVQLSTFYDRAVGRLGVGGYKGQAVDAPEVEAPVAFPYLSIAGMDTDRDSALALVRRGIYSTEEPPANADGLYGLNSVFSDLQLVLRDLDNSTTQDANPNKQTKTNEQSQEALPVSKYKKGITAAQAFQVPKFNDVSTNSADTTSTTNEDIQEEENEYSGLEATPIFSYDKDPSLEIALTAALLSGSIQFGYEIKDLDGNEKTLVGMANSGLDIIDGALARRKQ